MALRPTQEEAFAAVDKGLAAQADMPQATVHGVDISGVDTMDLSALEGDAIQPEETGTEEQVSEDAEAEQASADAQPEKKDWDPKRQEADQRAAASDKRVAELEAQVEELKAKGEATDAPARPSLLMDDSYGAAPRVAIPEDDPEPPKRAVFDPDDLDTPDDKIVKVNEVQATHLEWQQRQAERQDDANAKHRATQESHRMLRTSQDVYMTELKIPESQRNPLAQAIDKALADEGFDWKTNPPTAITVKLIAQAEAHRLSSTLKPTTEAAKAKPGVAIDGTTGSRTAPPKPAVKPGLKSRGSVKESIRFHIDAAKAAGLVR